MYTNSFNIFNASAGSGKTYTLTKTYLKIILSSKGGYRKILAITFTNKAVNEMKERILDSLFIFSKTSTVENAPPLFIDLLNELSLEVAELQQKAKTTLKKILHNYAFFDVSTIDKFTHRLIRTFAKDLKIPQNFEVILDTELLLDEAVSRLIYKAGSDPKLTQVLIDFALEKIEDDRSWDIAMDLNKIGKLIFNETNARHLKTFEDKSIEDFLELQQTLVKKVKNLEHSAQHIAEKVLTIISDSGLETTDFPRATLPNHFKKICDSIFDPSKLYNNTLETQLNEGKIVKSNVVLPDASMPSKILALFLEAKEAMYNRALYKNIYKNIVPLTVLNAIQQEVKTLQQEREQLSISEFNTIISNEIKDQPAPFIYERLGEKYRHYFIDEFQDTSEMQWNNLIPLIDNALSSELGSLFIVGDAKQAIYRWRGGKAEQFLNLVNLVENPFVVQPTIENLPSNYRSHEEIIQFNNSFFTTISPLLNNTIYESLFQEGNQQNTNHRKGGYVQLTFLEEEEELDIHEQYGCKIVATINELKEKGFTYSDICILVRGNKEGVVLANYLTQEHIPIISSESLLLKSSPKINFLIHLLHYQNQPDDEATVFELLSFLCREEDYKNLFISNHLKDPNTLFKNNYNFDLDKIKQLSVFDTLEYAIKQFDLDPSSDAYINFFMDTVLEVEQKEGTSIPTFLAYWQKKKEKLSITAPTNINAVQIMTIHKSKGLEFEVVIYPYANSKIYNDFEGKLWLPTEEVSIENFEEVLISKKQEVINYKGLAAQLYEAENNKLELDAFNVLYVALTRAVRALYIISKKEKSSKKIEAPKSYSDLFIHFLKEKALWQEESTIYEFGTIDTITETTKSEILESIPYSYSYKERESFKILTSSGNLWDTDSEAALSKGNLIHYIMSLIETKEDIEEALRHSLKNGSINSDEIDTIRPLILKIINHPELQPYFESGNIIKNEKEIITKKGGILRPDRIIIKDTTATVIDYKTGKRAIQYKDQIESYADALEEMGFAVAHKIIVYINEEITPEFI